MAILGKNKKRTKSVLARKVVARKRKAKISPKLVLSENKKEILGFQELNIGKAKFSNPQVSRPTGRRSLPDELPVRYGYNRMVLQLRDPWWLYCYWEVVPEVIDRLKSDLGDSFYRAKRILRVYDVTGVEFNGTNANHFFDIQINDYADNWYINAGPARNWCVELGLLLGDGRFIMILRSNVVSAPLDGPSSITDEEWMIPEDMFARLYGAGFGISRTSPGKLWQQKFKPLFSGVLASPGMGSGSPVKKKPDAKKFWLIADAELIVYGATEPDAKLTVQAKSVALRPDGTFTLRFALPNGKQVIEIKARSADGSQERSITPIVSRETK